MAFALRVMRLVDTLPGGVSARVVAEQLCRSATSVSANYRAARRARSPQEFRSKLSIVVEEIDEAEHWLELVIRAEMVAETRMTELRDEANQLLRIFSKMRRTAYGK